MIIETDDNPNTWFVDRIGTFKTVNIVNIEPKIRQRKAELIDWIT